MYLVTVKRLCPVCPEYSLQISYSESVWGNTKLQKLQNRAARIITFQCYDARSAEIRKQVDWEELASRLQKRLRLLICNQYCKSKCA